MRRIAAFILVLLFLPAIALADLEVHFLDVGQGDCAVILCDGETMIIDGGPYGASGKVYSYVWSPPIRMWTMSTVCPPC